MKNLLKVLIGAFALSAAMLAEAGDLHHKPSKACNTSSSINGQGTMNTAGRCRKDIQP